MPKAAVVFFSQNGTTSWVADAIAEGLRGAGYAVDLMNLRDGSLPDIRDYSLLGIGSPVYYYRLPFNVADYLEALPRLDGVPAFSFLVHGSHAFDTANSVGDALGARGARDVGHFRCHGEAYFLGHLREGYLFSPDHPSTEELAQATAFGAAVARRAADGSQAENDREPAPPLIYRLERFATSRWLVEQVYSRLFRVSPNRCTACGRCMDICPTGNVVKNNEGRPLWGRHCLYCLSCEMVCPEDAITSAISRPAFRALVRPFLRYNVRHWAREQELDHVRVVHRRGATERLIREAADDSPG
jgi:flavodoxin/Fe-S-cluster-containing hydrogenase component 2